MLCNANSYEATLFYLTVYYICSIFYARYNQVAILSIFLGVLIVP